MFLGISELKNMKLFLWKSLFNQDFKKFIFLIFFIFNLIPLSAQENRPEEKQINHSQEAEQVNVASSVWILKSIPVNADIKVESTNKNGQEIQIIYLPDGQQIIIPFEISPSDISKSGITPEEVVKVREESREILELTLKGLLSDDFSSAIAVDQTNEALTLKPEQLDKDKKPVNIFKKIFEYNHDLYQPSLAPLSSTAKLKRVIQQIWQFVFIETLYAAKNYYRQFKNISPKFTEFGIAIDIKLEPQVFIAKFNPTQKVKILSRSYALFFELAYSRTEHRLMVRTRYRREKGSGGLGLPAIKGEFKIFQTDGTKSAYKGKSWYPVSPPVVSFVLDSSKHYFAQGITIGINSGDIIPGSTLANTFTEFVQSESHFNIEDVYNRTSETIARTTTRNSRRINKLMCSQLFN